MNKLGLENLETGRILCLTHNDPDGYVSAGIVMSIYPNADVIVVGHDIDFDKCTEGAKKYDKVIITDFALPMKNMLDLNKEVELVWIDHHASTIKDSVDVGIVHPQPARGIVPIQNQIAGLRRATDRSKGIYDAGCQLTWEYFYPNKNAPDIIRAIGTFDTWNKTDRQYYDAIAYPTMLGLNAQSWAKDPKHANYKELLGFKDTKKISLGYLVTEGLSINKYLVTTNSEIASTRCYEVKLDGKLFLVLNTPHRGSGNLIACYDIKKHYGMIVWAYDGDKYHYSFYSDDNKNDVSKIAKLHGGGGHPGASGSVTTKPIPWTIIKGDNNGL